MANLPVVPFSSNPALADPLPASAQQQIQLTFDFHPNTAFDTIPSNLGTIRDRSDLPILQVIYPSDFKCKRRNRATQGQSFLLPPSLPIYLAV